MFLGGVVVAFLSSEFPGSFDDLMSCDNDLVVLDDGEIGKLVFGLDMFLWSLMLTPRSQYLLAWSAMGTLGLMVALVAAVVAAARISRFWFWMAALDAAAVAAAQISCF